VGKGYPLAPASDILFIGMLSVVIAARVDIPAGERRGTPVKSRRRYGPFIWPYGTSRRSSKMIYWY